MADEPTQSLRAADYFVAVHGLAMARSLMPRPADLRRRTDEIARIVESAGAFPHSLEVQVTAEPRCGLAGRRPVGDRPL